jgi:hypothetical protein
MPVSSFGRMPRAHLDPIVCVDDARAVFALQMTDPVQDETLVMLLDDRLCGSTLMTVTHTRSVTQLLDVAEAMGMIAGTTPGVAAVVLASVRGDGVARDLLEPGLWPKLDEIVEGFGVVLLDWLVTGPWGVLLPRAILGVPSRWPADA